MADRASSPRQDTDEELLARVHRPRTPEDRAGALEAIADRHYRDVLLFVVRRVRDADLAMELTQRTFADAIAVLLSGEVQRQPRTPDRLGAWLTGVAKNRVQEHFARRDRAARRTRPLGRDESMDDHPLDASDRPDVADDPVRLHQARRVIADVAATLPQEDRALYQWYFQEQLKPADIAARLAADVLAAGDSAADDSEARGTGREKPATDVPRRRRAPSPKTLNNRVTAVKTVVAEGFHAYLLVHDDRTLCPTLSGIIGRHPPGFTAPLRDHVVKHTYNCAQCGTCARCRVCRIKEPERITSACTASRDCGACEVCRRESTALKAGWAPALVLALYLRPVRDAISEVVRGAAPVGHQDGPPDRPRRRPRRGRTAAGAAAAVLVGAAGGATAYLLTGPVDAGPGGTRTITVVPVGAQGDPLPGYTVEGASGTQATSCSASGFAVSRDIVSCSPNVLTAQACWVRPEDRTLVLCGSPTEKRLREYRTDAAIPRTVPAPRGEVRPWAVELTDGRLCTPRWSGPPARLPDGLGDRYVCSASDGSPAGLLVEGMDAPVLQKSSPYWKARVVDRADNGTGFSRPAWQEVASVYYAGRP
ncbi:sigma-70 family RNA polymerase sigma factor [Streptomyces qinglanensis]|uniref:sigma-70 family RNA polymerase sigma factor n=1 Tax=Streptomyces qinglanensis TaxID=943816 RepID=UPI003D75ADB3